MFVVLEGWVCRYKILPSGERQIMTFMIPGDTCDLHIKLLAEMDHSIQAVSAAKVATVSKDDMQATIIVPAAVLKNSRNAGCRLSIFGIRGYHIGPSAFALSAPAGPLLLTTIHLLRAARETLALFRSPWRRTGARTSFASISPN